MNSMTRRFGKLLGGLALLVLAWLTGPSGASGSAETSAAPDCKPVQIAEGTQCVKDQLKPLRDAKAYDETTTVTDNSETTRTVTFTFEPKCRHDPTPCGTASRSLSSTVDCKTGTASCP
jgi:hypothetical protein